MFINKKSDFSRFFADEKNYDCPNVRTEGRMEPGDYMPETSLIAAKEWMVKSTLLYKLNLIFTS